MNHYPRHIGDWMRDTAHLSGLEECYYSRLIDQYYIREKPLPVAIEQCCRLVRAITAGAKKIVAAVLREFFTLMADGWHQKRCDVEIATYLDGEPAREHKKENERERSKRHREQRQALFDELRTFDVVPPYSTKTEALRSMLVTVKSQQDHAPVTRDVTANQNQNQNQNQLKEQSKALSGSTPDPVPPDPQKIDRSIETRRLRSDAVGVLEFLNLKANRAYQPVPANIDHIVARFKEGFTAAQCRQVIAKKLREWGTDAKMETYVRPKTLFNRTNFANYAGELVDAKGDENAA